MSEDKVPKKFLAFIEDKEYLITLCEKIDQPTKGSKELLRANLQRKIKFGQLTMPMLKEIGRNVGMPMSITKEKMIEFLVEESNKRKRYKEPGKEKEEGKGKRKEPESKKQKPPPPPAPELIASEKKVVTRLSKARYPLNLFLILIFYYPYLFSLLFILLF